MTFTKDITIHNVPINATNGEVIKAVLGIKDEQIVKGEYETVIHLKRDSDSFMSIDSKVYDAPYQKGGET